MSILTDADLAFLRAAQAQALPGRANIERVYREPDARGGYTETTLEVAQDVPYRMALASNTDITATLDQWRTDPRWTITMPYDIDVVVDDLILLSHGTYRVVGLLSANEDWETCRRLAVVPVA